MIELNKKTQQDFLNRKWVQRLLDAGVDMSDAKYVIGIGVASGIEYVILREEVDSYTFHGPVIPTYTVSEMLYKLHEWIYPTIEGKEYSGGLTMLKDAPFYIFYYDLKTSNYDKKLASEKQVNEWNDTYISAEFEYPIESLASLLIQCHKKDIGIKNKEGKQISDVGNISCK